MDPCPYLVIYSLDILKKKTKVLDISITDKKCLTKFFIKSSSQEIWIRIRFLEINRSPSLIMMFVLSLLTMPLYVFALYMIWNGLVIIIIKF
jgi:hypothetical protein